MTHFKGLVVGEHWARILSAFGPTSSIEDADWDLIRAVDPHQDGPLQLSAWETLHRTRWDSWRVTYSYDDSDDDFPALPLRHSGRTVPPEPWSSWDQPLPAPAPASWNQARIAELAPGWFKQPWGVALVFEGTWFDANTWASTTIEKRGAEPGPSHLLTAPHAWAAWTAEQLAALPGPTLITHCDFHM